ncbi:NRT1/ PTR family protein 1.2, partial [Tanacetum coccineum]
IKLSTDQRTPGELIPFAIAYLDHHHFLSLYPFGEKVMLVLIGSRIQIKFCFKGLLQFGSACEVFLSASDLQFTVSSYNFSFCRSISVAAASASCCRFSCSSSVLLQGIIILPTDFFLTTVNGTFEKVASFGILLNMILYLLSDYHMSVALGANVLLIWSAATNTLPKVGAFLSDSLLGRFLTIFLGFIFSLMV